MVRENNRSGERGVNYVIHPKLKKKAAKTTDETATKMAKMEMGIGKSRSMYSIVHVVVVGHQCCEMNEGSKAV